MGYDTLNNEWRKVASAIYKKPVVVNDEVVIRRIMSLGAALDHRVVDAIHGGKLFKYIKQVVRNPHILVENPSAK